MEDLKKKRKKLKDQLYKESKLTGYRNLKILKELENIDDSEIFIKRKNEFASEFPELIEEWD